MSLIRGAQACSLHDKMLQVEHAGLHPIHGCKNVIQSLAPTGADCPFLGCIPFLGVHDCTP